MTVIAVAFISVCFASFVAASHVRVSSVRYEVSRVFANKDPRVSGGPGRVNGTGCACRAYNCGCCAHLKVVQIGLNETVCTNMTYLPAQYGVSLTVSLNGVVWYNNTVSMKNPPPVCLGVPYLKQYASLCLQFWNLSLSKHSFSGCVRVLAKLKWEVVDRFELGCFKMPPGSRVPIGNHGNVGKPKVENKKRPRLLTASTVVHLKTSGHDRSLGCRCWSYDCGCCAHLELASLAINNTVCANLTFEATPSSVTLSISVDKKVYLSESISLTDLSPVCVPLLPVKEVDVCVQLYNVTVKAGMLSVCARLIARLETHPVDIIDLGCFHLPLPHPRRVVTDDVLYFKDRHQSRIEHIIWSAYVNARKEKLLGNAFPIPDEKLFTKS